MQDDELLDGGSFYFRKDIGQVGIVIPEFLADVVGVSNLWKFLLVVNHIYDQAFYLLNKNATLIVQQFQSVLE